MKTTEMIPNVSEKTMKSLAEAVISKKLFLTKDGSNLLLSMNILQYNQG
jgi:hypothetical protein